MFYVISFDDGEENHGEFNDYLAALRYAENHCKNRDYTIEEYDCEEDYWDNQESY